MSQSNSRGSPPLSRPVSRPALRAKYPHVCVARHLHAVRGFRINARFSITHLRTFVDVEFPSNLSSPNQDRGRTLLNRGLFHAAAHTVKHQAFQGIKPVVQALHPYHEFSVFAGSC